MTKLLPCIGLFAGLMLPVGLQAEGAADKASATASRAEAAPLTEADKAYKALLDGKSVLGTKEFSELPRKEQLLKSDAIYKEFATGARTFFAMYPSDPRRWELIVTSAYQAPRFIKGFKPEFETQPEMKNVIIDTEAKETFTKEADTLLEGLYTAKGVDSSVAIGGCGLLIMEANAQATQHPSAENRALLRKRVDALNAIMPADAPETYVTAGPEMLIRVLKNQAPGELESYYAELRKSSNKLLRDLPEAEAKQMAVLADVGTIKFKALDGRDVDLSQMRGKVILVDFWATWCGPCKAELPNVKAVYRKYHDKGFEVVGISLDYPNSQKVLEEFVAKNEMPWPQQYDGKAWKTDLVVKYGIKGIPAMFLIDKQGKLASLEARGPELEKQVARLLSL